MGEVTWRKVNDDPLEYAIQQGPRGDEFVKLLDGSCLCRPVASVFSYVWKKTYALPPIGAKVMTPEGEKTVID